jgi:hypothetical protein
MADITDMDLSQSGGKKSSPTIREMSQLGLELQRRIAELQ